MELPSRATRIRRPPVGAPSAGGSVLYSVNEPWVPRRSGTHMPDSMSPRNGSAGKVIGTRRTVLKTPCSPSTCQKGLLFLRNSMTGRRDPRAGWIFVDDSSGRYVRVSRPRKSKMLCLPGLQPVMKLDQATGEIGGQVDRSSLKQPSDSSFRKWGSCPLAASRR